MKRYVHQAKEIINFDITRCAHVPLAAIKVVSEQRLTKVAHVQALQQNCVDSVTGAGPSLMARLYSCGRITSLRSSRIR